MPSAAPRFLKSGIRVPAAATLRKYGMDESEWLGIVTSQGHRCPICLRVPPSGIMATDHEHVRGWKKLSPEERRGYVRGVVCVFCNRNLLHYALTREKACRIADYLIEYEERGNA